MITNTKTKQQKMPANKQNMNIEKKCNATVMKKKSIKQNKY